MLYPAPIKNTQSIWACNRIEKRERKVFIMMKKYIARTVLTALLFCLAFPALAADLNPMVLKSIRIVESQLGDISKIKKDKKIGVLVITLANPYWAEMKKRYEEWAPQMGVTVEILAAPTEGDLKSQLDTLQTMVAKDYDAIIVTPMDPFNLIPGILKANKKGIPIICSGPTVDSKALTDAGGHLNGWISATFLDQGRLAAEDMVKKLGKSGGDVAIIEGIPGAGQSEARKKGASDIFKNAPGVSLVSVQPGKWNRNLAFDITTNLIKANPKLRGLYCANDVMALAAADALLAAGKSEGVLIYGTDFIPEAQKAIREKKLQGSTTFSQAAWTRGALIFAVKLASKVNDLPKQLDIPIILATFDNISDFKGWK